MSDLGYSWIEHVSVILCTANNLLWVVTNVMLWRGATLSRPMQKFVRLHVRSFTGGVIFSIHGSRWNPDGWFFLALMGLNVGLWITSSVLNRKEGPRVIPSGQLTG